jgi:hypothetical protein
MKRAILASGSRIVIAMVWLINGLICKILGVVPRHERIVAGILGEDYAFKITKLIGVAEVMMVIWILSGSWKRFCAVVQIAIVAAMNIIEFALVPELLLFGRMNAFFALCFILFISLYEFNWNKQENLPNAAPL